MIDPIMDETRLHYSLSCAVPYLLHLDMDLRSRLINQLRTERSLDPDRPPFRQPWKKKRATPARKPNQSICLPGSTPHGSKGPGGPGGLSTLTSEEIKDGLRARGWKQRDLSRYSGVTQCALSAYVRGQNRIPYDKGERIRNAFAVHPASHPAKSPDNTPECIPECTALAPLDLLSFRVPTLYNNTEEAPNQNRQITGITTPCQ